MILAEVIKRVKCINNTDTEFLTTGKIYDVIEDLKMIEKYAIVDNGGYVEEYSYNRFELIND